MGGALSYFFSGPIAQAYGWRMAMVIAAVPAFLLLPALLFLDEPQRGASETHQSRRSAGVDVERPAHPHVVVDHRLRRAAQFQYVCHRNFHACAARAHSRLESGAVGNRDGNSLHGRRPCWRTRCGLDRRSRLFTSARMVGSIAAALISLGGAPFAYFGAMQPKGARDRGGGLVDRLLRIAQQLLRTGVFVDSGYRRARAARSHHGALFHGDVFVRRIVRTIVNRPFERSLRAAVRRMRRDRRPSPMQRRALGLQQAILIVPVLSVLLALVLYMGSRTIAADISRREAAAALARTA